MEVIKVTLFTHLWKDHCKQGFSQVPDTRKYTVDRKSKQMNKLSSP